MDSIRTQIVARLKTLPELETVSGVVDLVAALQGSIKKNGAYVWRNRAIATPNSSANAVVQKITEEFCILIATKNVRDNGVDSTDASDALCQSIRDLLIGFVPDGAATAITYIGGQSDFQRNMLFWQETFQCSYFTSQNYRN